MVTELLRSSADSWLSSSLDIMPRVSREGVSAFRPEGERGSRLLGVISQGRFDSYYAGKASPLLTREDDTADEAADNDDEPSMQPEAGEDREATSDEEQEMLRIGSVIERSPESARIILFSSNDFLRDQVVRLAGSAQQTEYLNTLQLAANAVDWSLEDAGLLSIRSRGHFNRTLPPLEHGSQLFREYLNYGMAVLLLLAIALLERRHRKLKQRRYLELLAQPSS